ncbi:MAG: hypothetical protein ACI4EI_05855 [Muricoprocola sp.]
MKEKSKVAVSIIGGSDGSTSIFLADNNGKKSIKDWVRTYNYKYKRKKSEKAIIAGTHTLNEVVDYAIKQYGAIEMDSQAISYIEQKDGLKERLVIENKPELLGDLQDIPRPDFSKEESVKEFFGKLKLRSERISEIPDNEIDMDFHVFVVSVEGGSLELGIDYIWNIFGVSYSGNDKAMKRLEKISKDLYLFYGVSEKDIEEKNERYSSLLAVLSS